MKRIAAVVQARLGSTRFPAKMLAKLGEHLVIEWVLRRISTATKLDTIVLATSDLPRDDRLAEIAQGLGLSVFRGSENDVLGRIVKAALVAEADIVVRVCADNPFISGREIDRLIDFFAQNNLDYASNNLDRLGSNYADGFGAEIVSYSTLKDLAERAVEGRHREHVTLYMWEHQDSFRLASIQAPAELAYPHMSFDVDTLEDLEKLQSLVDSGVSIESSAEQIVKIFLEMFPLSVSGI